MRSSSIQSFKDWYEVNGLYDSDPKTTEGKGMKLNLCGVQKKKNIATLRSAVSGNEEVENLLQRLQLIGEQEKEPDLDPLVRPCYTFRDELSVANGIAVTSSSMRENMLMHENREKPLWTRIMHWKS